MRRKWWVLGLSGSFPVLIASLALAGHSSGGTAILGHNADLKIDAKQLQAISDAPKTQLNFSTDQNQSDSSSTDSVNVEVNGQQIEVPDNGSSSTTIQNSGGQGSTHVQIDHRSSNQSDSNSNHSSSSLRVFTRSVSNGSSEGGD